MDALYHESFKFDSPYDVYFHNVIPNVPCHILKSVLCDTINAINNNKIHDEEWNMFKQKLVEQENRWNIEIFICDSDQKLMINWKILDRSTQYFQAWWLIYNKYDDNEILPYMCDYLPYMPEFDRCIDVYDGDVNSDTKQLLQNYLEIINNTEVSDQRWNRLKTYLNNVESSYSRKFFIWKDRRNIDIRWYILGDKVSRFQQIYNDLFWINKRLCTENVY